MKNILKCPEPFLRLWWTIPVGYSILACSLSFVTSCIIQCQEIATRQDGIDGNGFYLHWLWWGFISQGCRDRSLGSSVDWISAAFPANTSKKESRKLIYHAHANNFIKLYIKRWNDGRCCWPNKMTFKDAINKSMKRLCDLIRNKLLKGQGDPYTLGGL